MPASLVITVMSVDRVGIISGLSEAILELGGNIDALSQTVVRGCFTVIVTITGPDRKGIIQRVTSHLASRGANIADLYAVPGDTQVSTLAGLIADEAAIGVFNRKTTSVRVIPVPGKQAGETVRFGGLFGESPLMRVRGADGAGAFLARGGRIPAPPQSLNN